MRKNIVVCKWQPELVAAVLDLGADVHLILDGFDKRHGGLDELLLKRCRRVYHVGTFDSLDEVSAVAVDLTLSAGPIDLVLSHSELSQFAAGYLELLLGVATRPVPHVAHRDKRLMKHLVRQAGAATASFYSLPDPTDAEAVAAVAAEAGAAGAAVAAGAAEAGAPLIVKPAAGYGSMNTVRVDSAAELAATAAGFRLDPRLRSRHLIVEGFVEGHELAVDALWSGGRELALVVHQYHQNRMTITSTSLDGSYVLPPEANAELYERIRALHRQVNQALDIREGATHMEVFTAPDGELIFSEIASRVGGAWIPLLLSAHHGQPIWRMIARAAVHGDIRPARPEHRYVGAVSLRPSRPGLISAMPTETELTAFRGVVDWAYLRRVGDRTRLSDPSDYCLHVVLGAESEEELQALCRAAQRGLVIETGG